MIYFEDARLEFFGHADRLHALLLGARSDRQAQDRLPDADRLVQLEIRRRARSSLLLGAGARLRRHLRADDHHQAGPAAAGRIPPAPAQRRLFNPRRRHPPARQGLFHPQRRHRDARLSRLARQRGNRRPVRAQPTNGSGAGTRCCCPTRPSCRTTTRICRAIASPIRSRPARPKASRSSISPATATAAISTRARSIIYGFSEADAQKPDSGHPSGDRLQLHLRPSGPRRRARLQRQFHQPDAQPSQFRRDHPDRGSTTATARRPPIPRSRPRPTACCAAFPAPTPASRPKRIGGAASPTPTARCSRRSPRCAPMPRSMQINNDPGVSNYIDTGDTNLVRAMPTVGLEYRYPFINVQSWGTQTIEPIAQVIVRPNETQVGKWPNEDAQSLMFDDSNLFRVDKFSGWDRVEGGGRANYGVQYTAQFNQGGFFNVLFGQSYSLFGANSFADRRHHQYRPRQRPRYPAIRLCGARCRTSPTAPTRSRRASASTTTTSTCSGSSWKPRANFDRWNVSRALRRLCRPARARLPGPAPGHPGHRLGQADANWVLLGAARYDINAGKFDQTRIGLGYVDDCLILALNYITNYTYSGNPGHRPHDHAAAEPAHARRHVGQPGVSAARGRAIDRGRRRRMRRRNTPDAMDIAMPRNYDATIDVRSHNGWRRPSLLAAAALRRRRRSAQVVVIANGSPITELDIEQRSKLIATSTHKTPTRQEVINELIDDRLKIAKAKSYGLDGDRRRSRPGLRQHGEAPAHHAAAVHRSCSTRPAFPPNAIKARIRAEMTWSQLVRGKFGSALQVGEADVARRCAHATKRKTRVGYIYTLYPVIVVVPVGSSDGVMAAKRREAENLRGRFVNCKDGLRWRARCATSRCASRSPAARPIWRRNCATCWPSMRGRPPDAAGGDRAGPADVRAVRQESRARPNSPAQARSARGDLQRAVRDAKPRDTWKRSAKPR